jgi:GNAT superfamily N-acetyltransferase
MALEIRPLSRDEVAQGLPLFAGYQRFYGVIEPDDEQNRVFFMRFVEPSDDGLLLGAWDDRVLVGFACLYWTFSSVSACGIALMSDLFVSQGDRGRGIGRALIDAAVNATRRHGLRRLEWYTAPNNLIAQRAYNATGARRSTWIGYEIPIDGARSARRHRFLGRDEWGEMD